MTRKKNIWQMRMHIVCCNKVYTKCWCFPKWKSISFFLNKFIFHWFISTGTIGLVRNDLIRKNYWESWYKRIKLLNHCFVLRNFIDFFPRSHDDTQHRLQACSVYSCTTWFDVCLLVYFCFKQLKYISIVWK